MFKGLKNRLQDEANKLKENFQGLNENISSNASTSSISADLVSLDDTNDDLITPPQQSNVQDQTAQIEQKLSKEWKARLDQREAEWSQRLSKAQEEMTIKVAECKAQSHQALEQKDAELCNWIAKYHEATKKADQIQQEIKKNNVAPDPNAKEIETKLLQENNALAEEIEELRQKLTSVEREKAEIATKIEESKQQLPIIDFEAEHEKKVDESKTEQDRKHEQEMSALREQVDQLQRDVVSKSEAIDRLREDIETMSTSLNQKSKLIAEYEEKIATEGGMEEKFQKAKQLLRDLNDSKKRLEGQLEESRTRTLAIISAHSSEPPSDLSLYEALAALELCARELQNNAERQADENAECFSELEQTKAELEAIKSKPLVVEKPEATNQETQSEIDEQPAVVELTSNLQEKLEHKVGELIRLQHAHEKLKAQLKEAESKVEESESKRKELEEKSDELRNQLENVHEQRGETEKMRQELEEKNEELQQTREHSEQVELELKKKIGELNESVEQFVQQNDAMEKKNKDFSNQIDELRKHLEEATAVQKSEPEEDPLEAEVEQWKERCSTLENQLRGAVGQHESKMAEMETVRKTNEDRNVRLEDEKKELSSQIEKLSAELNDSRARAEELEQQKEELLADQTAAEQKWKTTAEELKSLNEEIQRIHALRQEEESAGQREANEREELKAEIERINSKMSEKDAEIQRLTDEKRQTVEDFENLNEEVTAMKQLIRDAQTQSDDVKKERDRLKEEADAHLKSFNEHTQRLQSLEEKCKKLEEDNRTFNEEATQFDAQRSELETAKSTVESELSALQSTYDELVSSNKETVQQNVMLQSQLQSLFLELDDLSKTKEELSRNNELLVREREQHARTNSVSNEKFEEVQQANAALQHEIQHLKKLAEEESATNERLESIEQERSSLEKENGDLRKLIDEAKQQSDSLKNDVAVYRREAEVMFGVVAKAQEKNKELDAKVERLEEELKNAQSRFEEQQSNDDSHGWDMDSDVVHDELETLRTSNEKLLKELDDSKELLASIRTDGPPLEYVQNIIYKYLMNKDSLGKGAVPLVRVIAAATGMNTQQTKDVITNEEKRVHTNNTLRSAVNMLQPH